MCDAWVIKQVKEMWPLPPGAHMLMVEEGTNHDNSSTVEECCLPWPPACYWETPGQPAPFSVSTPIALYGNSGSHQSVSSLRSRMAVFQLCLPIVQLRLISWVSSWMNLVKAHSFKIQENKSLYQILIFCNLVFIIFFHASFMQVCFKFSFQKKRQVVPNPGVFWSCCSSSTAAWQRHCACPAIPSLFLMNFWVPSFANYERGLYPQFWL